MTYQQKAAEGYQRYLNRQKSIEKVFGHGAETRIDGRKGRKIPSHPGVNHRGWKTRRASSRYSGVYPVTGCNSWRAQLFVGGKTIYLGSFKTQKQASKFYGNQLANFLLGYPIEKKRRFELCKTGKTTH